MRLAYDRQSMRNTDVDGRLHVTDCRISKANVCPYYGREIPNAEALGLEPERIYMLWRHPDELAAAASTFANLQLLLAHIPVNSADPQIEMTAGVVGSDVRFEAPYLVASLAVWTDEAKKLIETRAQAQLSCSYRYTADMTPGLTPEGLRYDGVMRNIIGNHVALVEEGRAGPDVLVNDAKPTETERTMKYPKLIAALIARAIIAKDAKPEALDAELEKLNAKDADLDDEDDEGADDEVPGGEGVKPGPNKGEVGAALDAAIKAGNFVTASDAKAMADAARVEATAAAVRDVNALHAARTQVQPLVGVVALDSADAVLRFALDHAKVDHKGIKELPALVALVDASVKAAATPAQPAPVRMAADAVNAVATAIPGLARIARA